MGVTGLWKLIEPCGKPVPVETLEGKVLAIDISIWLHQVVKGFQDSKGAALNNAHLLGLFHRLCKLMYYRVKPVFVFDGCVPQLKKDTIARRQQQRSKLNTEADRIQTLLLQSLAKEKVVQQALGPNAELLLTSPTKKVGSNKTNRKENPLDDMFKLPELPSSSKNNENHTGSDNADDSFNDSKFCSEDYATASGSTDDSSFDESNPRRAYNLNIQAIDVKSKEFLQLPADVRHDILMDIKETRKQSSWGRLHELPSRSDDFSNFQMKRLLKRRDVQVGLETAEQEMGGHTLTYAELTDIFSEEGILKTDIVEKGTKQITSDENTRFLLVKDLKKKLAKVKEEPKKEENEEVKKEHNSTVTNSNNHEQVLEVKSDEKKLGNEFDADLELAIALSLEEDSNRVYDEKDYDYDSDESLKLSKAQRQHLQNAAKGPARTYMIEYAGMNQEEVANILEKTQANTDLDDTLDIERLVGDNVEKEHEVREPTLDTSKEHISNNESEEIRLCVTDDSDSEDSDLVEVVDLEQNAANKSNKELNKVMESNTKCSSKTSPSDLQEIKDTDSIETDFEEVEDAEKYKNKIIAEEECVIEETPPCLADEEEIKINRSQTLNIQIDLSERFKPEDDIFADIFEGVSKQADILEKNKDNLKEKLTTAESSVKLKLNEECKEYNNAETEVEIKIPPKSAEILSILEELKHQADEIKDIKLENIKISEPIIDISDDEGALKVPKVKQEIIEICDNNDLRKRISTPPAQAEDFISKATKRNSKSPNLRTPSKNCTMTEFYNVDYVVKCTPEKPLQQEEEEAIPKVKSPFFVNKTPRSGHKSGGSNSSSPKRKSSKANKVLFDQANENSSASVDDKLDSNSVPFKRQQSNEQDILDEAANILKSQKTAEELNAIAVDLAKQRQELENERNRQDRMGISITQRMNTECQDLLRLFGIPFIVAPMEAEAQCAFLDIVQLTHGTITDDSDIWLFGGRTVYKNFFAQNKHVLEFRAEQIEKDFSFDRKKLIQLACLVGSDYTTGIHGVGAVTALEILASFTPKEAKNKQDDTTTAAIETILVTLQRFSDWWKTFKSTAAPPGNSARLALLKKLKNIELHEGFPSAAVVKAYLTPKVDENKENFTWGYPDVESLREFARKTFGWTINKTDEILTPVLKKLNEKRTQKSIRNYFNVKNALSLRQIQVSKRVQSAIDRMSGNIDSDDTAEKPTKAKRARKTNKTAGTTKKKEVPSKTLDAEEKSAHETSSAMEAGCSNHTGKRPVKRVHKQVSRSEINEKIPQREKDLKQMDANKKLAAEIYKNTAKETKKHKA